MSLIIFSQEINNEKIVSERNYKLFKLMKTAKSFARIESPGNTLGVTEQEGVDPRSPD